MATQQLSLIVWTKQFLFVSSKHKASSTPLSSFTCTGRAQAIKSNIRGQDRSKINLPEGQNYRPKIIDPMSGNNILFRSFQQLNLFLSRTHERLSELSPCPSRAKNIALNVASGILQVYTAKDYAGSQDTIKKNRRKPRLRFCRNQTYFH